MCRLWASLLTTCNCNEPSRGVYYRLKEDETIGESSSVADMDKHLALWMLRNAKIEIVALKRYERESGQEVMGGGGICPSATRVE
jgi:hypothetical protein